ncbi:MAG: hypothetical protein DWQ01_20570 [Planctomycetota bacterium]|nr:MAG: hypothetical protein DWQ01_20570 [Planctomycetota bacterium]
MEVNMMQRRGFNWGSRLISRASCKPSITGICMSSTTNWNGASPCWLCLNKRKASSPSEAQVGFMPQLNNDCSRILRLVSLSSTTKTRTP